MDACLSNKIKNVSLLLMVMVVFLHSYNLDTKGLGLMDFKNYNWFIQHFISFGITRIAVPLFFIISGSLFVYDDKVSFAELLIKIKKRARTLFIPFITWSLIGIVFYFTLQQIPQTKLFFTNKLMINYTFFDFINALVYKPIPYQLWFLRDLMVLVILSPIILFLIKKVKVILTAIIFVFWLLNQDTVFLTSEALLFFIFGIIISQDYKFIINKTISIKGLPIIWLLILIIQILFEYYNYKIIALICLKISILIGVPSFWVLYDLLVSKYNFEKITEKITWTTFFIFTFHEPFLTFIKKITFFLCGKKDLVILMNYFIAPTVTILVSIFLALILRGILPMFYRFLTGGR
jgi:surface polysaccharide O-acyltransferase-like enzyme